MLSRTLDVVRAARFRAWALVVRARLRRLGGDLVLVAPVAPRMRGLPHVDVDGRPGTLTLRIGRDVKLGRDVVIDLAPGAGGEIVLHDRVTVGDGVRLQPWAGRMELDEDATIRDRCEIKSTGELRIGRRAVICRSVTIHCHERVEIGAQVVLAERGIVIDSDHVFDASDTFVLDLPVRSTPISIGDDVFLGSGVTVLRGSIVGARSVVAAGSVLNALEVPAGQLVAGVPARAVSAVG